jgi:methyl-accepting chemotaxis protein
MLTRKLGAFLGPIIGLLLIMAVVVIVLLQGVLNDLGRHQIEDMTVLAQRLRWVVLALAVCFVVLINTSVLVLLRMAGMILRPVRTLVDGTRELAQEHFDYRVNLAQADEFGLLAKAFNELAAKLQANEQRKLEMLQQTAVTLNHELNNASSIINLKLKRLGKQAVDQPEMGQGLLDIDNSLKRMTDTIQSLKNVRRIVLTDYTPGTKMLDLKRCVSEEVEELAVTPHDS